MAQPLTYLLDTNVWLERLLDQDRADEVRQLLETVPSDRLLVTDFSFHSIGLILLRLGRSEALLSFARDLFTDNSVRLVALEPDDMERLITVANEYQLDFDDAISTSRPDETALSWSVSMATSTTPSLVGSPRRT